MYVDASSACMYVPHAHLVLSTVRRGHQSIWDWSYGALPCGCWPLNPGPLQIRVLLSTEPSFQLSSTYCFRSCFMWNPPVLFSLSCVLPSLPLFHSGLPLFLFLYSITCCLFSAWTLHSIIVRGDPFWSLWKQTMKNQRGTEGDRVRVGFRPHFCLVSHSSFKQ